MPGGSESTISIVVGGITAGVLAGVTAYRRWRSKRAKPTSGRKGRQAAYANIARALRDLQEHYDSPRVVLLAIDREGEELVGVVLQENTIGAVPKVTGAWTGARLSTWYVGMVAGIEEDQTITLNNGAVPDVDPLKKFYDGIYGSLVTKIASGENAAPYIEVYVSVNLKSPIIEDGDSLIKHAEALGRIRGSWQKLFCD